MLWDRETLGAPRPALAADDRRAESAQMDHRLAWLARHEPRTWAAVASGEYAVGGPAAYLVARLTRGTWHVTDVAAVARSGMGDLDTGTWSAAGCAAAGLPVDVLPEPVASWGVLDRTDARSFAGLELPIAGLAAAAPATLLGRGGGRPGDAADVAAEGALLVLADPTAGTSAAPTTAPGAGALRPTLAWRAPDGGLTRALTASVSGEEVADVLAAVPGATLRTPGAHDAARGAAFLAGLGTGVWSSPAALPGAATRAEPESRPAPVPPQSRRRRSSAAAAASRPRSASARASCASARTSSASASSSSTSSDRVSSSARRRRSSSISACTCMLRASSSSTSAPAAASASSARARFASASASTCSAAASALRSASGSGTTCSSGRAVGSLLRAVAAKPSASGSASAGAGSTASTPVLVSAATSSPLRTARAQPSSTMAAVSVASTWSETAGVTFCPSPAATAAGPGGHRGGELAALAGERPELLAVEVGLRGPERGADGDHLVDLLGLPAHQLVHDPRRQRGLPQRLDLLGEVGVLAP